MVAEQPCRKVEWYYDINAKVYYFWGCVLRKRVGDALENAGQFNEASYGVKRMWCMVCRIRITSVRNCESEKRATCRSERVPGIGEIQNNSDVWWSKRSNQRLREQKARVVKTSIQVPGIRQHKQELGESCV